MSHHPGAPVGLDDPRVQAVATKALELIADGAVRRPRSGRAGDPTLHALANRARMAGIPLIELEEEIQIDITVNGPDEVAPNLDLVKGWGGALVRERIAASKCQVILVSEGKMVQRLGQRGPRSCSPSSATAKTAIVRQVLEGARRPHQLPAQLIAPVAGQLRWFIDSDAAAALRQGAGRQ